MDKICFFKKCFLVVKKLNASNTVPKTTENTENRYMVISFFVANGLLTDFGSFLINLNMIFRIQFPQIEKYYENHTEEKELFHCWHIRILVSISTNANKDWKLLLLFFAAIHPVYMYALCTHTWTGILADWHARDRSTYTCPPTAAFGLKR